MKLQTKLLAALSLIIIGAISSCKKDEPAATSTTVNKSNCKVETTSVNDTLLDRIEYYSDGKVSKIYFYNNKGIVVQTSSFVYQKNKIIYTDDNGTDKNTDTSYIGSNGYVYMKISLSSGRLDTISYTHDVNGYLTGFVDGDYSEIHTILNGNRVKTLGIQHNGGIAPDTTVSTYEYDLSKTNVDGFLDPFLEGKNNTNVLKSETDKSYNGSSTDDFTYKYNSDGLVTEITTKETSTSGIKTSRATYTYNCK